MASSIVSFTLRGSELAFAATVTGLIAPYIHQSHLANDLPVRRSIYTIAVASLSMLFALLLLVPFSASFYFFPVDIMLFVLWIVAFGLLVDVSSFL
jgi:hypothetical protein